MDLYKHFVKPIADYFLAMLLLLFLGPFMFILFIVNGIVFSKSIFSQKRIGRHATEFVFYKFRSMRISNDERSIPAWGKFIRMTSLDELPQLINILRGQMSFIGPRPLLPEYLNFYNTEQKKRHLVKPGITGLAQVRGRNKLSWEQSLELDSYYAENCTFTLDIKILFLTIPQLFKFREINQSKAESREAFNKSKQ